MSVLETRRHQLFPVLDAGQIETAKRFASGPAREFAPGEIVFDVGERKAPAWLVLKGSIDVTRRDGLNRVVAITTHHIGQISGEVSQLAGRESLASGRAGEEGCTALPFDAAHVRALMIGSADIGEIIMRAFILRRMGLLEEGEKGVWARCWSAFQAPQSLPDFRVFSAAMDIPTRCLTRPPRTAAR
jgi:thioredoxin reductase (NADPH)